MTIKFKQISQSLSIISIINEHQFEKWHSNFIQETQHLKNLQYYQFKNNNSPVLHLKICTLLNNLTNFWEKGEKYIQLFKQLNKSIKQNNKPLIFQPCRYQVIDRELCLVGKINLNQLFQEHLGFPVLESRVPLIQLNDQFNDIENIQINVKIPDPIVVEKLVLIIHDWTIKTNNSTIVQWG